MRRKFYLNKRGGKLMGVCAGIADYTGIDAMWIRIAAALIFLAGFGSILIAYLIVGFVADPNPEPDRLDWPHTAAARGPVDRSDRRGMFGDVEHYYSASNPRLSREIDGRR